jgi:hypothetical protein
VSFSVPIDVCYAMFDLRVLTPRPRGSQKVSVALEFGVLMFLAWRQNEERGNVSWLSNESLAKMFNVSEMQISRVLQSLEARGLVKSLSSERSGETRLRRVLVQPRAKAGGINMDVVPPPEQALPDRTARASSTPEQPSMLMEVQHPCGGGINMDVEGGTTCMLTDLSLSDLPNVSNEEITLARVSRRKELPRARGADTQSSKTGSQKLQALILGLLNQHGLRAGPGSEQRFIELATEQADGAGIECEPDDVARAFYLVLMRHRHRAADGGGGTR